jgi:hypothetical protein
MKLVELKQLLDTVGYPVVYSHFNNPPNPPYIVYLFDFSSNYFADNKVYRKIDNIQIELYTTKKDQAAEGKLEKVLDDNEIPYEKTETWIDSEKLYQILYEVELI